MCFEFVSQQSGKSIFTGVVSFCEATLFFMGFFMRRKSFWSCVLVFILGITAMPIFVSCNANSEKLNLDGYELVFEDDFDGNALDLDLWEHRGTAAKIGGFYRPEQASVENGNLVIKAEYTQGVRGEAWYSGNIHTKEEFVYGYYEMRCICNAENDFWSAFWLTQEGVYDHDISKGGVAGAEIDVFESYRNKSGRNKNYIDSSVHCNGADNDRENIESKRVAKARVENLTTQYNTFGLMWTESEYIFYVNGVETGRTSFGLGVSRVPEHVVVSLCIPDKITLPKDKTTSFLVDYVKIYQMK